MRRFMHLRALKLNGFKSFADATELRFDRGVTAVVGPNGCGKSNIADAIRWVLGEQSAKALRGGKMQDVIFEGSDARKPLQLCEVSLLLTDCEQQLGTAFNEIEITRRVARDGTSDYLLNGRNVRLKDIQKLFMDTGVGRTSYSIMAQGQIDQVLSSKPEERRAIFEEAAGITKYKSQRREALNKLGLVDQNLARVTDVIAEVGRQIGTLKRQASKALRYRRLSHRLRHLDLAQSGRTSETVGGTIAGLEAQLRAGSEDLAQLQQDLAQKESEVAARKAGRSELLQRVQEAQQAVFDLRSQREQAVNQAHLADIRRTGLEERITQARDEMASTEAQLTELSQRADSSAQDKQLQLDVLGDSDGVFQTRNRELTEAEERLTRAEGLLQQLKYRSLEAESALVRLRNDCANLEVEDRTAQARSQRLQEEFAEQSAAEVAAREAWQAAQAAVEAAKQKQHEGQEAVMAAQQELSRLVAEFKDAQRRIQDMDRTVAQKTARLKLLQQLQEKLEGFGEGAKALMQGRVGGAFAERRFGALSEGLKVKAKYARAIETLLGAAVEAVLVDDTATARAILDQLAEQKLGRVCLKFPAPGALAGVATPELPVTIQPAAVALNLPDDGSAPHSVAGLLAGCYVAESAADFLGFWESNAGFDFHFAATVGGELIDRRGLVFGGQRKGGSGILQRAAEAKEIAAEIESDQAALAGARQVVDALNGKIAAAEAALDERRREHVETTKQVAALTNEERNTQRAVQEAENRRGKLERERESIVELHQRATERLEKARTQFASGEATLASLRGEMEETERQIATHRTERDVKREAVSQARFDLAEKRQRLEVLNRGLSELEARRSALDEMRSTREHEIELWSGQIEELTAEAAEQRSRAEESARTLTVAQESVAKTKAELVELEEVLTVLEREQAYVREQADARRGEVSKQQVDLAEKRTRIQFLQEEVSREHGVELSAIDWRYELWMAGQQPEGLRALDLDDDSDEPPAPPAKTVAGLGEAGPESAAPATAEAGAAGKAPEPKRQPTPEELAKLDASDWEAVKNEVAALRQRLQSMGPVNLVAIEEYGELKQRFEFLKAQSDDLVNSKNSLLAAIEEINRTSEKQFSETFEQIRKNFRQTFNTLFGGGHVDLVLVEGGDVLESGIDIIAQPPGTKLKSISLLSGGQKTMTAVALLFAIYLVKPSPFCVLDELDAPLDESNIGRFTTLLKQFTENSQFIMITHNKRTIAASQAIYGVTMEERGVSKIVSLRFHTEHHEPDMAQLQLALTPTGAELPRGREAESSVMAAAGTPGSNRFGAACAPSAVIAVSPGDRAGTGRRAIEMSLDAKSGAATLRSSPRMRIANFSTPLSWAVALAFLGLAIPGIWERFDSASYNREVFPEHPTEPLGADRFLDYEFTARYEHVPGLWIFVDAGTTTWSHMRLQLSVRERDATLPFWSQDFDLPQPESGTGDRFCAVENLTLHRGGRYIMRFEMPDTEAGKAWRIRVNYWDGTDGVVRWEGHEVRGVEPVMVWLGSRPQFPRWQLWSAALLLAAWSLVARERTRFAAPAWVVMAAGCAVLAAYGWQYRLWQFWGTFWPDEYPWMSMKLHGMLTGAQPWGPTLAEFAGHRNAQAFFVPLVMALFQVAGLSIKFSYLASNLLFFLAAVGLMAGCVRRLGMEDDRAKLAVGLLFFAHVSTIHAAGSLQTDMAGMTMSLAFVFCGLQGLAATTPGRQTTWFALAGVAACLGASSRVALLPLLVVSVGLVTWSLAFARDRSWGERARWGLPTVVGGLLLWICWSGFGLWASLAQARAFAARPEFVAGFNWPAFVRCSLWGLQLGLPVLVLCGRRLISDPRLAFVVGAILGLEGMLAVGHIVPWLRYWGPVAVLGVVLTLWAPARWPQWSRWYLAAAWIVADLNVRLLVAEPNFAF